MRTWTFVLGVALALSFVWSCSDDDAVVTPDSPYKNLTLRDHVLVNLQQACDDRNIERYDELLDTDFVFFFSNTDYQNGSVQYDRWGRAAEIGANRNMFDPTFSKPPLDPVSDIDLVITYARGEDKWVEVTPPDPVKYPNETWYGKVVTYSLTVKAGATDYVVNNIQASFTVRWANDERGQEYWRIVIWRDDTGSRLRDLLLPHPRSPSTEDTTWGQVKALYSG